MFSKYYPLSIPCLPTCSLLFHLHVLTLFLKLILLNGKQPLPVFILICGVFLACPLRCTGENGLLKADYTTLKPST